MKAGVGFQVSGFGKGNRTIDDLFALSDTRYPTPDTRLDRERIRTCADFG